MTRSDHVRVSPSARVEDVNDEHSQAHGSAWSRRRARRGGLIGGALPPITTILARPLYLVFAAIVGLNIGWLATTTTGYTSEAVVQFSNASNDSLLVKQVGQTMERRATSKEVLDLAANELGLDEADLRNRVTAEWKADTQLVGIQVTAPSPEEAEEQANEVATAMVAQSEATISDRLKEARAGANELLKSGALSSVEAEAARRSQLGSALASTQASIAAEAGQLVVADSAVGGVPAGLTKPMGAAIGMVAAVLLAALITLLIGIRGLHVMTGRSLKVLLPGVPMYASGQVPQLAGQLVESGKVCVVVVALRDAHPQALDIARELRHFIQAHGRAVDLVDVSTMDDREEVAQLLGRDARQRAELAATRRLLLPVVDADTEAAALLEGQADVSCIVVAVPMSRAAAVLRQTRAFDRADPAVVLVR
jgi:hypothetical protein